MAGFKSKRSSKNLIQLGDRKHATLHEPVSDGNRTITFRHWRVLQAVYDYGGLTEAAAHLHVTPPTISYAMQNLEKLLGIKLYHVEGRKTVFTLEGAALVQRSRNLLRNAIALEVGDVAATKHPVPPDPISTLPKDQ